MKTTEHIQRIVDYLRAHPALNVVLVTAYFFFILFMHHPLVLLSIAIEKRIGIELYNVAVAVIFLSVVAAVIYVLVKAFRQHRENRRLKVFYLVATLLLLVIHSRFMFDSNIEVIHAMEFTFLSFLIFPLVSRFGAAVFFTLPFMLIDEWYQYILLYPDWNDYFDLNDILMDTYGCGLTMSALMILGIKNAKHHIALTRRAEFISWALLIILVLAAVQLCFIAPYASDTCGNTLLIMNERITPEPFLRFHPSHNIWYHVMQPAEGFAVIMLLHLFYFGMDGLSKHTA
ncbi:MAG: hypothetical protein KIS94_11150 [Chitinophagales bacterium]|nr:hypothetical protein [Chitinophagales bacterium]